MIELDDNSELVAKAAELGDSEPFDMQGKHVYAEHLRAILMSLPVKRPGAGEAGAVAVKGAGVRIKSAVVDGVLDLEDGRWTNGQALPPLELNHCRVSNEIKLSRARLRHLSLKDSQITHLEGYDLQVESSIDLSGLKSAEEAGAETGVKHEKRNTGLCWVELQRARIDGGIEAAGAVFACPEDTPWFVDDVTPTPYALNLRFGRVRGGINLQPHVKAYGGIGLAGAQVEGDIWGAGADLVAGKGFALNAQTASIGGSLILRAILVDGHDVPFRATGGVGLLGITITRGLEMSGACVDGDLIAGHAEIGSNLDLQVYRRGKKALRFKLSGDINVQGAKVIGYFAMTGARIGGVVDARNVEVRRDIWLDSFEDTASPGSPRLFRFMANRDVDLSSVNVTGCLNMSGARLRGQLLLENAEIGDAALLKSSEAAGGGPASFLGASLSFWMRKSPERSK